MASSSAPPIPPGMGGACVLVRRAFHSSEPLGARAILRSPPGRQTLPVTPLTWYDDLLALTDDPVRRDPAAVLARAVAVGHVRGPAAGLRETDRLRDVIGPRHRWHAVRGHLHELDGDLAAAGSAYAEAARRATDVAERDHLVRRAARARAAAVPPSDAAR